MQLWPVATLANTLLMHVLLLYREGVAVDIPQLSPQLSDNGGWGRPTSKDHNTDAHFHQNPKQRGIAKSRRNPTEMQHDCEEGGLPRVGVTNIPPTPTSNTNATTPRTQGRLRWRFPCFWGSVKTSLAVYEGDSAELMCFIHNVNFKTTLVSWWKDSELQEMSLGHYTQNPRFQLPRRFKEDWTLIITNAQLSDAGSYSCQINGDTLIEKRFNLQVLARVPVPATQMPVAYITSAQTPPPRSFSGPLNDERFDRRPLKIQSKKFPMKKNDFGSSVLQTASDTCLWMCLFVATAYP